MTRQSQSSRTADIQLEQLYNHAPVGLAFLDTELRFVRINERLAAINGPSVEAHIGRTLSEIIPEIAPIIEPIYRDVIETGEPRLGFEVNGKTAAVPPKDVTAIVSYLPLIEDGRVLGVHTVVQDITENRNLQKMLLEATEREQRRIGQEFHDVTGQELTGLGYLARSLAEALKETRSPEAGVAVRIADGIERALSQARILTRGLIPVEVSAEGLMAALTDLTDNIHDIGKVECTFECTKPVLVADNRTATHLFRIAQESITNALKHSRATQIHMTLCQNRTGLSLSVADNGTGIRPNDTPGLGTQIMQYRAQVIGANITVSSSSGTGTVVTCTLPQRNADNG